MHRWRTLYDPETRRRRHSTAPGFGHALLAPLVGYAFKALRVSGAVWEHGSEWWPIHAEPTIATFATEHGKAPLRNRYNERSFAQVRRERRTVRGVHMGLSDLFVPILSLGRVVAVLVAGPFVTARPTSVDILERWRSLTGREGHPSDPEFASYLAATLATLVLDDGKALRFARLLECLATLMAGEGQADALTNEAEALHQELERVRLPEAMWEAVRSMVDERAPSTWQSRTHAHALGGFGLSGPPDHVLVGLGVRRAPAVDPVDEQVRGDAFQRACVELARMHGEVIAGRVGDRGVVLLSAAKGAAARKHRELRALSERVAALAGRRFGLELHFGVALAMPSAPLSRAYEAALGAADSALTQGTPMIVAEADAGKEARSLRDLRRELAVSEERPELLVSRFERYLEATALHFGYRHTDAARGHLEAGFERLTDPLLDRGALDKRSFAGLCAALDRAAMAADTMGELLSAYRRAALDVTAAVERPVPARQDRSLRAALDHIHAHFCEPLRLARVARIAGFAPSHFSKLFILREKTSFEHYVRGLRIERARQLLTGTALHVTRIADLCGFNSLQYFGRAFRAVVGTTPRAYRTNPAGIKSSSQT